MSTFADAAAKKRLFITAEEAELEREAKAEQYRRMGKEPPPEVPEDTRSLAERLAEAKRIKDEEYDEMHSLRNHVPLLDEEDSEYLNDVFESQRAMDADRRRREMAEVAAFRSAVTSSTSSSTAVSGTVAETPTPSVARSLLLHQTADDGAIAPPVPTASPPAGTSSFSGLAKQRVSATAIDRQRAILTRGVVLVAKRKAVPDEPQLQLQPEHKRARTTAQPPPLPASVTSVQKGLVAYDSSGSDSD
ncbi:N-terminal domain of NEFA-interacting nuclear protein NIP30-domain-containing protein [Blastocladiella britannica]|nr:N-terminal domain of NEFA-interacting nuclear protein NIP30-domain-containing protein [Blastocladiella britannica]